MCGLRKPGGTRCVPGIRDESQTCSGEPSGRCSGRRAWDQTKCSPGAPRFGRGRPDAARGNSPVRGRCAVLGGGSGRTADPALRGAEGLDEFGMPDPGRGSVLGRCRGAWTRSVPTLQKTPRSPQLVGQQASLNEFELIRRISALLPPAPPEVLVPLGDDCAVLEIGDSMWAAASDMLVSGHHFEDWAAPEDVGYKAVAVNASDVAAMGGTPRFVLSSGGAPDPETALRCSQGILEACERFGIYPLGGDTTRADALTVDVAILGELATRPVLRSGAKPGDLLAVTGDLGASAAGLLALERGMSGPERLIRKCLRPEPRLEAGRAAARLGATAMIDLSDGLASDVGHVCDRSGAGCSVDLDLLPINDDTRELAESLERDPEILAATGGEDYELLICAPGPILDALANNVEVLLTPIGEITRSEVVFMREGKPVQDLTGWNHFT